MRARPDRRQGPRRESERHLHYAHEALTITALEAHDAMLELGALPELPEVEAWHLAVVAFRAAREAASVSGATIGPDLPDGERPWPVGWADKPAEYEAVHAGERSNGHPWERVTIVVHDPMGREPVVRCKVCHVPRCGHSTDMDPCMLPRHHDGDHELVSGAVVARG